MVLDNSLTGLQMSGLLCLVKYSNVPLHFCKSHVPQGLFCLQGSLGSLLAVNLGVPGVRDNLSFIALSQIFVLDS